MTYRQQMKWNLYNERLRIASAILAAMWTTVRLDEKAQVEYPNLALDQADFLIRRHTETFSEMETKWQTEKA